MILKLSHMRRVFKSDVHSYCEYPTSAIYRFLSILWTLSEAVHSYWQDSEPVPVFRDLLMILGILHSGRLRD
jgi:hypothetical protein